MIFWIPCRRNQFLPVPYYSAPRMILVVFRPPKVPFPIHNTQEIARLKEEANRTADGVLALEKAVATLRHEAKEVDDAFERKFSEVEADAAVIEKVGSHLPCLVSFPVDLWA